MQVKVSRLPMRLGPDLSRVVTRLYMPEDQPVIGDLPRATLVLNRAMGIPEDQVSQLLEGIFARFGERHRDLEQTFLDHYEAGRRFLTDVDGGVSRGRRMLVGAYLTGEYAIQAAGFCNPSMVASPDREGQAELPPGHQRFILSVRAIGEGHISSIEFRTGVLNDRSGIHFDDPPRFATGGRRTTPTYDKRHMVTRLREMRVNQAVLNQVFESLPDVFAFPELESALEAVQREDSGGRTVREATRLIHWLASSNYVIEFAPETTLSERVLAPAGPADREGMEDARFVRFVDDDDDTVTYYATYTAYDGFDILPQLIETRDFLRFRFATLSGSCAVDKGMALFGRRVGGDLLALSRYDGESLYLLRTGNLRSWNYAERLSSPTRPWELNKIGNCGSPLETDVGWLVLTHGMGPMRVYAIGAMLLDLTDPSRVIGYLREPLLVPGEDEQDGYVPNVVYSCGGILHNNDLVIPYGISDREVGFATVSLDGLLTELLSNPPE